MAKKKKNENMELSIFDVGPLTCAVNINGIQEFNKHLDITPVHNAPHYVRGLLNLRGQIITVIDLRKKFGFEPIESNNEMRIIVVKYNHENVGLLVDKIVDVLTADPKAMDPPPSNINGVAGGYFSSIYKMEEGLAAVLNIVEILKMDESVSSPVM